MVFHLTLLMIGSAVSVWAADPILLGNDQLRLGIDRATALPVFVGVSDENWMPKIPADLKCSDPCRLNTIEPVADSIRSTWQTASLKRFQLEYAQRDRGVELLLSSDAELAVTLRIPFNPRLTSITFLSSARNSLGDPILPGVVSAPDKGQLAVGSSGGEVVALMEGSRGHRRLTWVLKALVKPGLPVTIRLAPAAPLEIDGVDAKLRDVVSRYWWNIFTVRAGDDPNLEPNPIPVHRLQQMIANNTLSDPVSFAFFNVADMALAVRSSGGVELMRIVQESLTWWLENQITERGVAIGYGDRSIFLDANPSLLISAWDVVEKTGDTEWLARHIGKLEVLGNYLAARDIDGDGLVEAEMPGTPGYLIEPGRSSNWIDAINFGHKDAFANALVYRGWLCLSDMEWRLGNRRLSRHYRRLAARLKLSYAITFYNADTRMLAGWVDAAGRRAPYRFPGVNGLAVSVGLVPPVYAKSIMRQIMDDLVAAGFRRYDLGVPLTLDPIEPFDYLAPGGLGYPDPGIPDRNWQKYENGGVTPTQTAYYLQGLVRAGLHDEARRILEAMLETQTRIGFQNGIVNEYPLGVDWRTWEGEPSGYEGYLNDNYYYLLTASLLDPFTYWSVFRPTMQHSCYGYCLKGQPPFF